MKRSIMGNKEPTKIIKVPESVHQKIKALSAIAGKNMGEYLGDILAENEYLSLRFAGLRELARLNQAQDLEK